MHLASERAHVDAVGLREPLQELLEVRALYLQGVGGLHEAVQVGRALSQRRVVRDELLHLLRRQARVLAQPLVEQLRPQGDEVARERRIHAARGEPLHLLLADALLLRVQVLDAQPSEEQGRAENLEAWSPTEE